MFKYALPVLIPVSKKFSLLVLGVFFSVAAGKSVSECRGAEGTNSSSMMVPRCS